MPCVEFKPIDYDVELFMESSLRNRYSLGTPFNGLEAGALFPLLGI